MDKKDIKKSGGLGWFVTALFIVADLAGGGVVAMPVAMVHAGEVAGTSVIIILSIIFTYTAHLLAENWLILRSRWSIYEEHCRKPYPEMAYRAMGSKARLFCSSTINCMLFGISVVYLLLSSHIINEFVSSVTGKDIGFCYMLLILAAAFWPVSLLKSPQDFWWAILLAMLTTLFSVILIIVGTAKDYSVCGAFVESHDFKLTSFIFSLGTFMFGFGGHAVFPTIQHDMKQPKYFTRSAVIAFGFVTLMYGPISVFGYLTYGSSLDDSIINSVQTNWMQRAANLFIAIHCVLTLTLNVNPLNQEVEQLLKLPQGFGWHRVVVRTVVLIAVVFVAETIPKFGPLLDVMGGTVIALTAGVLPLVYNLYLKAATYDLKSKKYKRPTFFEMVQRTPKLRLVINLAIIVIAVICGTATTYRAVVEMLSTQFSRPCYLSAKDELVHAVVEGAVHCCGPSRNVSRFADAVCHASATV